jgi:hypothetical protein
VTPDEAAAAQLRLYPSPITPRTRRDYRRIARWWELEAVRTGSGEDAAQCRRYASNMRWAAELVGWFGEGTWPELNARYASAVEREKQRRAAFEGLARAPKHPGHNAPHFLRQST